MFEYPKKNKNIPLYGIPYNVMNYNILANYSQMQQMRLISAKWRNIPYFRTIGRWEYYNFLSIKKQIEILKKEREKKLEEINNNRNMEKKLKSGDFNYEHDEEKNKAKRDEENRLVYDVMNLNYDISSENANEIKELLEKLNKGEIKIGELEGKINVKLKPHQRQENGMNERDNEYEDVREYDRKILNLENDGKNILKVLNNGLNGSGKYDYLREIYMKKRIEIASMQIGKKKRKQFVDEYIKQILEAESYEDIDCMVYPDIMDYDFQVILNKKYIEAKSARRKIDRKELYKESIKLYQLELLEFIMLLKEIRPDLLKHIEGINDIRCIEKGTEHVRIAMEGILQLNDVQNEENFLEYGTKKIYYLYENIYKLIENLNNNDKLMDYVFKNTDRCKQIYEKYKIRQNEDEIYKNLRIRLYEECGNDINDKQKLFEGIFNEINMDYKELLGNVMIVEEKYNKKDIEKLYKNIREKFIKIKILLKTKLAQNEESQEWQNKERLYNELLEKYVELLYNYNLRDFEDSYKKNLMEIEEKFNVYETEINKIFNDVVDISNEKVEENGKEYDNRLKDAINTRKEIYEEIKKDVEKNVGYINFKRIDVNEKNVEENVETLNLEGNIGIDKKIVKENVETFNLEGNIGIDKKIVEEKIEGFNIEGNKKNENIDRTEEFKNLNLGKNKRNNNESEEGEYQEQEQNELGNLGGNIKVEEKSRENEEENKPEEESAGNKDNENIEINKGFESQQIEKQNIVNFYLESTNNLEGNIGIDKKIVEEKIEGFNIEGNKKNENIDRTEEFKNLNLGKNKRNNNESEEGEYQEQEQNELGNLGGNIKVEEKSRENEEENKPEEKPVGNKDNENIEINKGFESNKENRNIDRTEEFGRERIEKINVKAKEDDVSLKKEISMEDFEFLTFEDLGLEDCRIQGNIEKTNMGKLKKDLQKLLFIVSQILELNGRLMEEDNYEEIGNINSDLKKYKQDIEDKYLKDNLLVIKYTDGYNESIGILNDTIIRNIKELTYLHKIGKYKLQLMKKENFLEKDAEIRKKIEEVLENTKDNMYNLVIQIKEIKKEFQGIKEYFSGINGILQKTSLKDLIIITEMGKDWLKKFNEIIEKEYTQSGGKKYTAKILKSIIPVICDVLSGGTSINKYGDLKNINAGYFNFIKEQFKEMLGIYSQIMEKNKKDNDEINIKRSTDEKEKIKNINFNLKENDSENDKLTQKENERDEKSRKKPKIEKEKNIDLGGNIDEGVGIEEKIRKKLKMDYLFNDEEEYNEIKKIKIDENLGENQFNSFKQYVENFYKKTDILEYYIKEIRDIAAVADIFDDKLIDMVTGIGDIKEPLKKYYIEKDSKIDFQYEINAENIKKLQQIKDCIEKYRSSYYEIFVRLFYLNEIKKIRLPFYYNDFNIQDYQNMLSIIKIKLNKMKRIRNEEFLNRILDYIIKLDENIDPSDKIQFLENMKIFDLKNNELVEDLNGAKRYFLNVVFKYEFGSDYMEQEENNEIKEMCKYSDIKSLIDRAIEKLEGNQEGEKVGEKEIIELRNNFRKYILGVNAIMRLMEEIGTWEEDQTIPVMDIKSKSNFNQKNMNIEKNEKRKDDVEKKPKIESSIISKLKKYTFEEDKYSKYSQHKKEKDEEKQRIEIELLKKINNKNFKEDEYRDANSGQREEERNRKKGEEKVITEENIKNRKINKNDINNEFKLEQKFNIKKEVEFEESDDEGLEKEKLGINGIYLTLEDLGLKDNRMLGSETEQSILQGLVRLIEFIEMLNIENLKIKEHIGLKEDDELLKIDNELKDCFNQLKKDYLGKEKNDNDSIRKYNELIKKVNKLIIRNVDKIIKLYESGQYDFMFGKAYYNNEYVNINNNMKSQLSIENSKAYACSLFGMIVKAENFLKDYNKSEEHDIWKTYVGNLEAILKRNGIGILILLSKYKRTYGMEKFNDALQYLYSDGLVRDYNFNMREFIENFIKFCNHDKNYMVKIKEKYEKDIELPQYNNVLKNFCNFLDECYKILQLGKVEDESREKRHGIENNLKETKKIEPKKLEELEKLNEQKNQENQQLRIEKEYREIIKGIKDKLLKDENSNKAFVKANFNFKRNKIGEVLESDSYKEIIEDVEEMHLFCDKYNIRIYTTIEGIKSIVNGEKDYKEYIDKLKEISDKIKNMETRVLSYLKETKGSNNEGDIKFNIDKYLKNNGADIYEDIIDVYIEYVAIRKMLYDKGIFELKFIPVEKESNYEYNRFNSYTNFMNFVRPLMEQLPSEEKNIYVFFEILLGTYEKYENMYRLYRHLICYTESYIKDLYEVAKFLIKDYPEAKVCLYDKNKIDNAFSSFVRLMNQEFKIEEKDKHITLFEIIEKCYNIIKNSKNELYKEHADLKKKELKDIKFDYNVYVNFSNVMNKLQDVIVIFKELKAKYKEKEDKKYDPKILPLKKMLENQLKEFKPKEKNYIGIDFDEKYKDIIDGEFKGEELVYLVDNKIISNHIFNNYNDNHEKELDEYDNMMKKKQDEYEKISKLFSDYVDKMSKIEDNGEIIEEICSRLKGTILLIKNFNESSIKKEFNAIIKNHKVKSSRDWQIFKKQLETVIKGIDYSIKNNLIFMFIISKKCNIISARKFDFEEKDIEDVIKIIENSEKNTSFKQMILKIVNKEIQFKTGILTEIAKFFIEDIESILFEIKYELFSDFYECYKNILKMDLINKKGNDGVETKTNFLSLLNAIVNNKEEIASINDKQDDEILKDYFLIILKATLIMKKYYSFEYSNIKQDKNKKHGYDIDDPNENIVDLNKEFEEKFMVNGRINKDNIVEFQKELILIKHDIKSKIFILNKMKSLEKGRIEELEKIENEISAGIEKSKEFIDVMDVESKDAQERRKEKENEEIKNFIFDMRKCLLEYFKKLQILHEKGILRFNIYDSLIHRREKSLFEDAKINVNVFNRKKDVLNELLNLGNIDPYGVYIAELNDILNKFSYEERFEVLRDFMRKIKDIKPNSLNVINSFIYYNNDNKELIDKYNLLLERDLCFKINFNGPKEKIPLKQIIEKMIERKDGSVDGYKSFAEEEKYNLKDKLKGLEMVWEVFDVAIAIWENMLDKQELFYIEKIREMKYKNNKMVINKEKIEDILGDEEEILKNILFYKEPGEYKYIGKMDPENEEELKKAEKYIELVHEKIKAVENTYIMSIENILSCYPCCEAMVKKIEEFKNEHSNLMLQFENYGYLYGQEKTVEGRKEKFELFKKSLYAFANLYKKILTYKYLCCSKGYEPVEERFFPSGKYINFAEHFYNTIVNTNTKKLNEESTNYPMNENVGKFIDGDDRLIKKDEILDILKEIYKFLGGRTLDFVYENLMEIRGIKSDLNILKELASYEMGEINEKKVTISDFIRDIANNELNKYEIILKNMDIQQSFKFIEILRRIFEEFYCFIELKKYFLKELNGLHQENMIEAYGFFSKNIKNHGEENKEINEKNVIGEMMKLDFLKEENEKLPMDFKIKIEKKILEKKEYYKTAKMFIEQVCNRLKNLKTTLNRDNLKNIEESVGYLNEVIRKCEEITNYNDNWKEYKILLKEVCSEIEKADEKLVKTKESIILLYEKGEFDFWDIKDFSDFRLSDIDTKELDEVISYIYSSKNNVVSEEKLKNIKSYYNQQHLDISKFIKIWIGQWAFGKEVFKGIIEKHGKNDFITCVDWLNELYNMKVGIGNDTLGEIISNICDGNEELEDYGEINEDVLKNIVENIEIFFKLIYKMQRNINSEYFSFLGKNKQIYKKPMDNFYLEIDRIVESVIWPVEKIQNIIIDRKNVNEDERNKIIYAIEEAKINAFKEKIKEQYEIYNELYNDYKERKKKNITIQKLEENIEIEKVEEVLSNLEKICKYMETKDEDRLRLEITIMWKNGWPYFEVLYEFSKKYITTCIQEFEGGRLEFIDINNIKSHMKALKIYKDSIEANKKSYERKNGEILKIFLGNLEHENFDFMKKLSKKYQNFFEENILTRFILNHINKNKYADYMEDLEKYYVNDINMERKQYKEVFLNLNKDKYKNNGYYINKKYYEEYLEHIYKIMYKALEFKVEVLQERGYLKYGYLERNLRNIEKTMVEKPQEKKVKEKNENKSEKFLELDEMQIVREVKELKFKEKDVFKEEKLKKKLEKAHDFYYGLYQDYLSRKEIKENKKINNYLENKSKKIVESLANLKSFSENENLFNYEEDGGSEEEFKHMRTVILNNLKNLRDFSNTYITNCLDLYELNELNIENVFKKEDIDHYKKILNMYEKTFKNYLSEITKYSELDMVQKFKEFILECSKAKIDMKIFNKLNEYLQSNEKDKILFKYMIRHMYKEDFEKYIEKINDVFGDNKNLRTKENQTYNYSYLFKNLATIENSENNTNIDKINEILQNLRVSKEEFLRTFSELLKYAIRFEQLFVDYRGHGNKINFLKDDDIEKKGETEEIKSNLRKNRIYYGNDEEVKENEKFLELGGIIENTQNLAYDRIIIEKTQGLEYSGLLGKIAVYVIDYLSKAHKFHLSIIHNYESRKMEIKEYDEKTFDILESMDINKIVADLGNTYSYGKKELIFNDAAKDLRGLLAQIEKYLKILNKFSCTYIKCCLKLYKEKKLRMNAFTNKKDVDGLEFALEMYKGILEKANLDDENFMEEFMKKYKEIYENTKLKFYFLLNLCFEEDNIEDDRILWKFIIRDKYNDEYDEYRNKTKSTFKYSSERVVGANKINIDLYTTYFELFKIIGSKRDIKNYMKIDEKDRKQFIETICKLLEHEILFEKFLLDYGNNDKNKPAGAGGPENDKGKGNPGSRGNGDDFNNQKSRMENLNKKENSNERKLEETKNINEKENEEIKNELRKNNEKINKEYEEILTKILKYKSEINFYKYVLLLNGDYEKLDDSEKSDEEMKKDIERISYLISNFFTRIEEIYQHFVINENIYYIFEKVEKIRDDLDELNKKIDIYKGYIINKDFDGLLKFKEENDEVNIKHIMDVFFEYFSIRIMLHEKNIYKIEFDKIAKLDVTEEEKMEFFDNLGKIVNNEVFLGHNVIKHFLDTGRNEKNSKFFNFMIDLFNKIKEFPEIVTYMCYSEEEENEPFYYAVHMLTSQLTKSFESISSEEDKSILEILQEEMKSQNEIHSNYRINRERYFGIITDALKRAVAIDEKLKKKKNKR